MNPFGWFRSSVEDKADQAIALTDEATDLMRERARSPDPFRAIMADFWLQKHDVGLLAEVYSSAQEARIFRGPTDDSAV